MGRMLNDWSFIKQMTVNELHKRDPQNPFYKWLSEGASDELAELILTQLPKDGNHQLHQWSFMRADSEKAYSESMGWEFVFLIDHLLDAPTSIKHENINQ